MESKNHRINRNRNLTSTPSLITEHRNFCGDGTMDYMSLMFRGLIRKKEIHSQVGK